MSKENQFWKSMESAPVNESVLIFIPNADHYGHGVYRGIQVDMGTGRRWKVSGLNMGRDCGLDQPTHWMPLPPDPATAPYQICADCAPPCCLTDATVHRGIANGATKEEIITQLVNEKNALIARVVTLEMIAPKRYRKPDGSEWVYHIPNHLIPLENAPVLATADTKTPTS